MLYHSLARSENRARGKGIGQRMKLSYYPQAFVS